jgi:hypothetical protein
MKMFWFSRSVLLALLYAWAAGANSLAQSVKDKVVKPDPQAVAVAEHWLASVDRGNYTLSHRAVTARVRAGGSVSEQQWVAFLKERRAPLGRVISRTLYRARFNTSISGSPDGNYEFLDYKTKFERKAKGFEIVTLTKETGHWEVSGYHFK